MADLQMRASAKTVEQRAWSRMAEHFSPRFCALQDIRRPERPDSITTRQECAKRKLERVFAADKIHSETTCGIGSSDLSGVTR